MRNTAEAPSIALYAGLYFHRRGDCLPPAKSLRPCRGDKDHGRTPHCAEIHVHSRTPHCAEVPVRGGGCSRQLLVVPLRKIQKPAVLRRFAQGHRIHPGEVHGGEGREAVVVRLQAHPQPALLRRNPQDPLKRDAKQASRPFKSAGWNGRLRRRSSRGQHPTSYAPPCRALSGRKAGSNARGWNGDAVVRFNYFLVAVQRPSAPLSRRNEPAIWEPVTRPVKSRRTPLLST